MIHRELEAYIRCLRSITLEDSLSDGALAALGSCYVSLQHLVVANGWEAEYGSRKIYEAALDRLYGICLRRSSAMEIPSGPCDADVRIRRSRLLALQYDLLHRPMRVAEPSKVAETRKAMHRLVDEWMRGTARGLRPKGPEGGVLHCIACLYGYVPEEERLQDAAFVYFRQRLDEWAESLNGKGQWDRLPESEALRRLSVMALDADLFPDRRYDALLERALRAYTRQMLDRLSSESPWDAAPCPDGGAAPETDPCARPAEEVYRLYDLLRRSPVLPDPAAIDRIIDFACRELARTAGPADASAKTSASSAFFSPEPSGTGDARLWSLAILTAEACRRADIALEAECFAPAL